MISSVAGPATTARRLTTEPAKSEPPQPFVHPTQSRTPAATAIKQAGTYTREDTATRTRRAARSPRGTHPSAGARVGSTMPVDTTVLPTRRGSSEGDAAGAGVGGGRGLGGLGLHGGCVPGTAEGVDAIAL